MDYLINQLKQSLKEWELKIIHTKLEVNTISEYDIEEEIDNSYKMVEEMNSLNDILSHFMSYGQSYQMALITLNDLMLETQTISN